MTPGRLVLAVALVGSAVVAAYALFIDRGLVLSTVGFLGLGVSLAITSVLLARAAIRAGWAGRGGKSVGAALLGGFCALMASGSLAAAIIFGLLSRAS